MNFTNIVPYIITKHPKENTFLVMIYIYNTFTLILGSSQLIFALLYNEDPIV